MTQTVKNGLTAKHSNSNSTIGSGNELHLIEQNGNFLIDARLLHEKLKVRSMFANWIKRRVDEFDFEENKDFFLFEDQSLSKNGKRKGGQNKLDYHLTIDMAKELAMLERNAVGKQVRRYFIEAEKELRTKRLYAMQSTLTEISKTIKPLVINGRKLFDLRMVQQHLGFSTKSSTSNIRRAGYGGLIVIVGQRSMVAEEYVKVMMASAKTRALRAEAKSAQPILELDWEGGANENS